MMDQNSDDIAVRLTRAQALVLFEWLATHTGEGAMARVPFEDSAERDVLWALEGKLEKLLPELFAPDYKHRVEAARDAVR